MRNHVTHQVTRLRDTVRVSLNRSAHWVSKHTTKTDPVGTASGDVFSFRSSYGPWTGFSKAIDDETIWLEQDEEERAFDEKLQTFFALEHGTQPARSWLLDGS